MLEGLLEKEACAKCRYCCVFDRYDIWETPTLLPKTMEKIAEFSPETEFLVRGDNYTFKIKGLEGEELFRCPALTENGCMLGEDEPFECKVWPFRVMSLNNGNRVIAVSSFCGEIYNSTLKDIMKFLKNGLEAEMFQYAQKYPEIVKSYDGLYPILMVEENY